MPDQEIIDKVAMAIYNNWANYSACSVSKSWEETCEKLPAQANDFRRKAIAAIKAIREPTLAMLDTAMAIMPRSEAKEVYTAMIDSILND